MSFSILRVGSGIHSHALYDSATKTFILKGTPDELSDWKHTLETADQDADNREHMAQIKKERLELLIAAGNSEEKANEFLFKTMPYLYDKKAEHRSL